MFYLVIEKTAKPFPFDHVTFSFEKSVATVAVESLCSLGSDCVDIIDCRLFPENSLLYILYFTFILVTCRYHLIGTDDDEDEGYYAAFYFLSAIGELFAKISAPHTPLW